MSYFARRQGRDWQRRVPVDSGWRLEFLEARTMLSATAAAPAASSAQVASITVLKTSLPTAVTGSKITFATSVENASSYAPIISGKVSFVVEGPQKITLGDVSVNKVGQAGVSTSKLTKIGDYRVKAEYTPSKSGVSASVAAPVSIQVIPSRRRVPTSVTVVSGAPIAEAGQYVPLEATVKDAGTGHQVDAGKVATIAGTVEFVTVSPHPIVLGELPLNISKKTVASSSNLLSIFGITSSPATLNEKDQLSISTKKLKEIGLNQIEAKFLPTNNAFTASTSAPVTVTITPQTQNAPTVTSLETQTNRVETGEAVALNMTVQNGNSSLAGGTVEFTTVSPHPVVLGKFAVSEFDQPISLATDKLQRVGTYQIEADYAPSNKRFAKSTSAPVTITVTPLTAASFRVTPLARHGHLNQPISFVVTALDPEGQPLTNYTGTVVFTSPSDSWTIFPKSVYASLAIAEPSPETTGLATLTPDAYTFTSADHGSHTFVGGVTFAKAGQETIEVNQANDGKVHGKASISVE